MYIIATSILAPKEACTLFRCHLNKSRHIHPTECYIAKLWQLCKHEMSDVTTQQSLTAGRYHSLHVRAGSPGPPEVNGDRDKIARKTLDSHPIRTSLLFKLFAGNILLCNNTLFFKSWNQVFTVKHCQTSSKNPWQGPEQSLKELARRNVPRPASTPPTAPLWYLSSKALHQPGTE